MGCGVLPVLLGERLQVRPLPARRPVRARSVFSVNLVRGHDVFRIGTATTMDPEFRPDLTFVTHPGLPGLGFSELNAVGFVGSFSRLICLPMHYWNI